MKTDVIFRQEQDGTILAVFPYEIEDMQGNVLCYAHIGQQSVCSYPYVIKNTHLAKDYLGLYNELRGRGYDLNVIQRIDYDKYMASYHRMKRLVFV